MKTVEPFPGRVFVAYSQIYLEDRGAGPASAFGAFFTHGSPVGLVGVEPGRAIMMTGLHTGTVAFAVTITDRDPGPALDRYEDIVEIDFAAPTGAVFLLECGTLRAHELPALPAGPGVYRLRYHALDMDAGRKLDTNLDLDHSVDEYLLQIWPAVPTPPTSLRVTSAQARYWQTPRSQPVAAAPPASGASVVRVPPGRQEAPRGPQRTSISPAAPPAATASITEPDDDD